MRPNATLSLALACCVSCGTKAVAPDLQAAPRGAEIGTGDGSPASVTFTEIYAAAAATDLIDLAFNQDKPDELWVVAYGDDSVHIGAGVTATTPGTWKRKKDPAAVHFMHKPTAIAWGAGSLWATCGDNDNSQNDPRREPNYFMGPALFTADPAIFATQNAATELGSHVDMLHNTSFCRGVAHVEDNWFFAFNSEYGSLDKYNFATPHEPGGDDHSDGQIYRYAIGQVKGEGGTPSHMAYDRTEKMLYIADTGNGRIVKLDPSSGTLGERLPRRNEVLAENGVMDGTSVVEVVPAGALTRPSGIEIKDDLLYVSDAATSTFHVFDKEGHEVRRLETGLGPNSLAGLTFSADGKLYFVNRTAGRVVRIDP